MDSLCLMSYSEEGIETLNTKHKQKIPSQAWIKKGVGVPLSLSGH